MIHSVSGGAWGNIKELEQCIEEIRALEDILSEIYAGRTGKTKEEISTIYFDGKEHWFNGEEALRLGFVDELYDADPVDISPGITAKDMYNVFKNRLNDKIMNLELIKKNPRFQACKNENDVLNIVSELEETAKNAQEVKSENETLRAELKKYKDAESAARMSEIKALLDEAEKSGRILKGKRENFKTLLEKDFENGKAVIESLSPGLRALNSLQEEEESAWESRMKEIKNAKN